MCETQKQCKTHRRCCRCGRCCCCSASAAEDACAPVVNRLYAASIGTLHARCRLVRAVDVCEPCGVAECVTLRICDVEKRLQNTLIAPAIVDALGRVGHGEQNVRVAVADRVVEGGWWL